MSRSISILGATGSIGASTLDLVRGERDEWDVRALTANGNARELAALAREFDAEVAVVADEFRLPELREALSGTSTRAAGGAQALCEAAAMGADMTVAAIVGCAGLAPVMAWPWPRHGEVPVTASWAENGRQMLTPCQVA